MSDVEVDPFDFMNCSDSEQAEDSVESFEEVAEVTEDAEVAEVTEEATEEPVKINEQPMPELEVQETKPVPPPAAKKPLVLTPTGTPTYAEMARSRPTSECVPDEPIAEDPIVEDIVVEDVVEEAPPAAKVQAPAPPMATPAAAVAAETADGAAEAGSKQSRAERKTKKAMQKLGLAQVEGINRVVLRKDKSLLFVVPNPEVFKRGDTWVVLGEARVEDPNQRAREMAAQNMAEKVQKEKPDKVPQTITEEEEDEEEVSAEGIEEKDIELVMQQAACSKSRAISALKNNQNDIVNAIMELTV